ncbi:MAG: glutathione S-transferase [Methylobacterium sp.]|uniref:glutathione S-transferase family protein n=1 Tax=Methylobacterium sp. TaxID=409 RepID=UPI0025E3D89B|nr:glutathione S-transferase [Methylobacterium sp.]MBX9933157.1 glutathione S-transferase [Methylobacterium sp.]
MKLFHSHFSPYARKVMVVAHELGLAERITLLPSAAHPIKRDSNILEHHPLAQVPTLITDDGAVLADSRVICEFLDSLGGGALLPHTGPDRWNALTLQSTADGVLAAALLIRYELTARLESERSSDWISGQNQKIQTSLQSFEARADLFHNRLDIGTITLGCALGYLDLRLPNLAWAMRMPALKAWYETFSQRPSMQSTRPPAA